MGDNNPMMVEYFTYKVEFQDRGAGHIHGVTLAQVGHDGKAHKNR
jgi:hypothetical protein